MARKRRRTEGVGEGGRERQQRQGGCDNRVSGVSLVAIEFGNAVARAIMFFAPKTPNTINTLLPNSRLSSQVMRQIKGKRKKKGQSKKSIVRNVLCSSQWYICKGKHTYIYAFTHTLTIIAKGRCFIQTPDLASWIILNSTVVSDRSTLRHS